MAEEVASDVEGAFPSWRAYHDFRREVTRESRYVRSSKTADFLTRLAAQSLRRQLAFRKGQQMLRAQIAYADWHDSQIGETLPGPALPDRMRPRPGRATEGRVNPKGIPCLYLAGDPHTAIAEVRPWIGSLVTLSHFETNRELNFVDCRAHGEDRFLWFEEEPGPAERDAAVWIDVGRAFREPVTRDDDLAAYAPTQIMAETFRAEGFDGLIYRSAFGTGQLCIALFDITAAQVIYSELHEIRDVTFSFEQEGAPYHVRLDEEGNAVPFRTVITDVQPMGKPKHDGKSTE